MSFLLRDQVEGWPDGPFEEAHHTPRPPYATITC
jgi:hypothetical protein